LAVPFASFCRNLAFSAATLWAGAPVPPPDPVTPDQVQLEALGARVAAVLPEPNDDYAVVLEDVASGTRLAVNDQRVFPSASLYKLALAWDVLQRVDRGQLDLEADLPIQDEDASEPEPADGFSPGDVPTLREGVHTMLAASSNTASHALLRLVGRADFNADMARLGLTQTGVPVDVDTGPTEAVTSGADMGLLLHWIATGAGLSADLRAELRRSLADGGRPDALRDSPLADVDVLDKTGNLADASDVAALLESARGTVVLVVLDQAVDPGDAREVIARLGLAAYDVFLRRPDATHLSGRRTWL
jgi:beta-lactamase class A